MKHKDKIKEIIEEIFKKASCTISKCEFINDDGMFWCMIETPDSHFMIGKEGETLRSINHIVQRILEKDAIKEQDDNLPRIFIDINNYQKKHFDNLKTIAHMMAERARYFKSNIELDPMSAFERRVIHMFLENTKDLKTESEGFGPSRRVVIKYIGENSII